MRGHDAGQHAQLGELDRGPLAHRIGQPLHVQEQAEHREPGQRGPGDRAPQAAGDRAHFAGYGIDGRGKRAGLFDGIGDRGLLAALFEGLAVRSIRNPGLGTTLDRAMFKRVLRSVLTG